MVMRILMLSLYGTLHQPGCSSWRWDLCINILIVTGREVEISHWWKMADIHWLVTMWDRLLRWGALSMSVWLMGNKVVAHMTFQHAIAATPFRLNLTLAFFFSYMWVFCWCVTHTCVNSPSKVPLLYIFLNSCFLQSCSWHPIKIWATWVTLSICYKGTALQHRSGVINTQVGRAC